MIKMGQFVKIAFFGNPGAGKSTLLNCLMVMRHGTVKLFESGVSIATGLTDQMQQKTFGEYVYTDNPGLDDVTKRQEAAKMILDALKQGGEYLVFFVLTLESGKLRACDLETIKSVLRSAPDIKQYAVVINKMTKPVYDSCLLDHNKQKLQKIFETIDPNKSVTMLFLRNFKELEGKKNATLPIPELKTFVENQPRNVINGKNVFANIDQNVQQIQENIQALKLEQDRITRKHDEKKRQLDEEKRRLDEQRETEKRKQEQEKLRVAAEAKRKKAEEAAKIKAEKIRQEEAARLQAAAQKAEKDQKEKEERDRKAALQLKHQQEMQRKEEELRQQQQEHQKRMAAIKPEPQRNDPVTKTVNEVRRFLRRF